MICRNIILVLCIVPLAFSQSIDERVDKIVQRVFKDKRLNPLTLHKDYERPINERIGLVRVRGQIKIAHVRLKGLSSIARTGHCKLETSKEGNKLLKLSLKTTNEMILEADVSGKLTGIPTLSAIPIEAHFRQMVAEVVIERNSKTHFFKLKKFQIADMPKVQIRLQGSIHVPVMGTIFDSITNSVIHLFNKKIKHVINKIVKPILMEEIKNPLYLSILMPK